jgi:hypothetical protein
MVFLYRRMKPRGAVHYHGQGTDGIEESNVVSSALHTLSASNNKLMHRHRFDRLSQLVPEFPWKPWLRSDIRRPIVKQPCRSLLLPFSSSATRPRNRAVKSMVHLSCKLGAVLIDRHVRLDPETVSMLCLRCGGQSRRHCSRKLECGLRRESVPKGHCSATLNGLS